MGKELRDLETEFDIRRYADCSKQEQKEFKQMVKERNPLPEDIYARTDGSFSRIVITELTPEQFNRLFTLKQTMFLRTIKNSIVFFVVLTVIGIILGIFGYSSLLSSL